MAVRQIAFLRTNRFDAQAEAQVESLSRVRDLDVVVCADERHGFVDTWALAQNQHDGREFEAS